MPLRNNAKADDITGCNADEIVHLPIHTQKQQTKYFCNSKQGPRHGYQVADEQIAEN